MKRAWEDVQGHIGFTQRLLTVMRKATVVAGGSSSTHDQLKMIAESSAATMVADARFALGANDGAYLRSNVMPLQTADTGCDLNNNLSTRLIPEMEAAGRAGLLDALHTELSERIEDGESGITDALQTAVWMLSISEVEEFVKMQLGAANQSDTAREARAMVEELFTSGGTLNVFVKNRNRQAQCEILRALLLLFDKPRKLVETQLETTLGPNGTGTLLPNAGLDRLATAARFTPSSLDAEKFRYRSLEVRRLEAAATFVHALKTNRLDFSVVTFPVGYDASDELDHPHSLFETLLRKERRDKRHRAVAIGDLYDGEGRERLTAEKFENDVKMEIAKLAAFKRDVLEPASDAVAQAPEGSFEKREFKFLENKANAMESNLLRLEAKRRLALLWTKLSKAVTPDGASLLSRIASLGLGGETQDEFNRQYKEALKRNDTAAMMNLLESRATKEQMQEAGLDFDTVRKQFEDQDTAVKRMTEKFNAALLAVADSDPGQQFSRLNGYALFDKNGNRKNIKALEQEAEAAEENAGRLGKEKVVPAIQAADRDPANNQKKQWVTFFKNKVATIRAGGLYIRKEVEYSSLWEELEVVAQGLTNLSKDIPLETDVSIAVRDRNLKEIEDLLFGPQFQPAGEVLANVQTLKEVLRERISAAREMEGQLEDLKGKLEEAIKAEIASDPAAGGPPALEPNAQDPKTFVTTIPEGSKRPPIPDYEVDRSIGFCTNLGPLGEQYREEVEGALCAAISQLREDGGAVVSLDRKTVRKAGVSPFFTAPRNRLLNREGEEDWWTRKLWPDGNARNVAVADLAGEIDTFAPTSQSTLMDRGAYSMVYALARGLCGYRPPHHAVPNDATKLLYNLPRYEFPGIQAVKLDGLSAEEQRRKKRNETLAFGTNGANGIVLKEDFVSSGTVDQPEADDERTALWAPVKAANVEDTLNYTPTPQGIGNSKPADFAVATACVLEFLVDHYNEEADRDGVLENTVRLAKACAAFAKISQMNSLGVVFAEESLKDLCNPYPIGNDAQHYFLTRPVMRCPGPRGKVLYPCDAGLATFARLKVASGNAPDLFDLPLDDAFGKCSQDILNCEARIPVSRANATAYMRAAIESEDGLPVPLYVAAAPGLQGVKNPDPESFGAPTLRGVVDTSFFPKEGEEAGEVDNLEAVLRSGLQMCTRLGQMKCELEAVEESRKNQPPESNPDDVARERREAVWTDAMREACISGDRLYAFLRQLSGTISEQVDTICQIDEGMLVRQQQQQRVNRQRMAERAAQEHMQLVRNVIGSVIRESGLTLGIAKDGDIGQLKVVSNTLRKQASEVASGTAGSTEGFFSNSVRLENLLAQGTGEMTLSDLFARLKDAGTALQQAAISAQPIDGVPGSGASLDFLSAPRNSLVLRYKPEALAAIKKAFETFQREMRSQHNHIFHRAISAYELIEGKDESLVMAFASFAAHVLVHSRLYSTSTAMYVAAWPAAANAQQLKISLQRLVRVACEYLASSGAPNFLANGGRDAYFGTTAAPMRYAAPRSELPYRGGWHVYA